MICSKHPEVVALNAAVIVPRLQSGQPLLLGIGCSDEPNEQGALIPRLKYPYAAVRREPLMKILVVNDSTIMADPQPQPRVS